MYIYNTTFNVATSVASDFLEWMKSECQPTAKQFSQHVKFLHVHTQQEDCETYTLQVECDNLVSLSRYEKEAFIKLMESLRVKFGKDVLPFSTLLEEKKL